MKGNDIARIVTKLLFPFVLLFALYVQFHGDYGPGGGFQAGVIFAAALVIYGLVYGLEALQNLVSIRTTEIGAAAGVALYGSVGMVAIIRGKPFLDYSALSSNPIAGQHYGILLVELGVGITVTAAMLWLFYSFADRQRIRRNAP